MSITYTPNNTFIFSFVRMNPPTPGHLVVIKTLIDKAIELNTEKVYILTSSSLDGKNPIPCSRETMTKKPKNKADAGIIDKISESVSIYKSTILEDMIASYKEKLVMSESDTSKKTKIKNLNIIVMCSTGSTFGFITSIIRNDFIDKGVSKINMFFIVGRDRANFLDTIVDFYKKTDFVDSIDGIILGREGMTELKTSGLGERDITEIDQSAYSGSFVRNLVKNGQREEFNQIYSPYLGPEEIQKMYETIQIGMQLKSPVSKEEDENPRSRYFDENMLPIIIKPIETGGKKYRKTRKNKRIKTKKRKYPKTKKKTKKLNK